jgi:hypothetical protein
LAETEAAKERFQPAGGNPQTGEETVVFSTNKELKKKGD